MAGFISCTLREREVDLRERERCGPVITPKQPLAIRRADHFDCSGHYCWQSIIDNSLLLKIIIVNPSLNIRPPDHFDCSRLDPPPWWVSRQRWWQILHSSWRRLLSARSEGDWRSEAPVTIIWLAPLYGTVWYGMVWYGMIWYIMIWYDMVWYGTVWYGRPL